MTDSKRTLGPRCTPERVSIGHVLGGSNTCSMCRLHAAAPELLAALAELEAASLEFELMTQRKRHVQTIVARQANARDAARAAIARARGDK